MKWIGIAGTRRLEGDHTETVVRGDVSKIFSQGNAIVSGGGLGVDFIAVDQALKHDPAGQRIKVIIPSSLDTYREYFNHRVERGIVKQEEVGKLFEQINKIRDLCASCLVELEHDSVNRKTFHARNTAVVEASDELRAYKDYQSAGTQNAINAALHTNKPCAIYTSPQA